MKYIPVIRVPIELLKVLWFLPVLLVAGGGYAGAQPHDTKGKEFWVAFMENFGSGGATEESSLRLYASCDVATNITVIYHATRDTVRIPLSIPNRSVEINVNLLFGDVELKGWEEKSMKSIHVVADDEITLYGSNVRKMSADAFLGLPDDVLTRSYIVLGYPNGFLRGQAFDHYDMPSEFAIIATEDGTTVRINPSAPLNNTYPGAPFTVGLDRGEVFFAQADLVSAWDVSGTEVIASKPVAVFGGNKRTSVPTRVGNYRDHLVEQMPPLEVWGKDAIATPHFPVTPQSPDTAVVRVLAAFSGTTWEINGKPQPGTLSRAKSVERFLTEPLHITASGPILVAQYEHSVNVLDNSGNQFELGDPFMMLVPPSEQFDTAYAFQSIDDIEFLRHFINVVIPTAASASLQLDGSSKNITFMPVIGTTYSYAQIELKAGSHYIRADSAFGLYAYGYGKANSYGYVGGMLFRKLVHDFLPPGIEQQLLCGRLDGFAFDSEITDSGIDSCYATRDTSNVDVTISPFVSGADTVRYSAVLVDRYLDGTLGIKAIDSGGRSRTQTRGIPGFTLRAFGSEASGAIRLDTIALFNGASKCQTIEVENYGRYKQTINSVDVFPLAGKMTVMTALPVDIAPGARASLEVCMTGWTDTAVTLSMRVAGECVDRVIAQIPVVSGTDTTAPGIAADLPACARDVWLTFSEPNALYSGIDSVLWDVTENCTVVETQPELASLPTGRVRAHLQSLDERRDMVYQVTLADAAGNRTTFGDTIGGFTLAILDTERDTLALRLNEEWNGDTLASKAVRCDSVLLTNYGSRQLSITDVRMRGNRVYSIPPAQLPVTIPPHSERLVAVCIDGMNTGDQVDTLLLMDGCGRSEELLMKTPVTFVFGLGSDRCNNALSVQSYGPAKRTFLATPVPNPATGASAFVDIGLPVGTSVNLELYDQNGTSVATVLRAIELDGGIHRVSFDISGLESGSYICRMSTRLGDVRVQKMVVNR